MKISKFITKFKVRFRERKFRGRLRYVHERYHNSSLVIVFSGFNPQKPCYNYIRTLEKFKGMDKLFILDDFGFRGSYYLFENGSSRPKDLTLQLISEIRDTYRYSHCYTAGSSKGGSCALYFGLEIGADAVFYGEAKFRLGQFLFLDRHKQIFYAMMGQDASEKEIRMLDEIIPSQIKAHPKSSTVVHMLYSNEESFHHNDIVELKDSMEAAEIKFTEKIESYSDHHEIGKVFGVFLLQELEKICK